MVSRDDLAEYYNTRCEHPSCNKDIMTVTKEGVFLCWEHYLKDQKEGKQTTIEEFA